HIAKRIAPTADEITKIEPTIRAQIEQLRRQQVVGEWINSLLTAPKTHIPQEALTGRAQNP
ncbi:MAG: hypothetical protein LBD30_09030, partial [Verrucomicrobiales bacterium]|nr:hypothetical protein [Verrucomicrobiales bacterium]